MRDFRLDQEKIKLQSIKLTLASISGLILAYLLVPKGLNIYILLTIAALMMVVDLLVYYIKKQHVWVTLSKDGIIGQAPSERKIHIEWHENISIEKSSKNQINGLTVISNLISSNQKQSLFIPIEIASTTEFTETIAKLAPDNHPLKNAVTYL
jgi:hypothetical protein